MVSRRPFRGRPKVEPQVGVQLSEDGHVADEFISTVEDYLASQHCTLWSHAWDVHNAKSRRDAAEWLAAEIMAVVVFSGAER